MDLAGQQWTIVLRQESFNVRFGSMLLKNSAMKTECATIESRRMVV
jgi:hypothetical protein